jgi:hypothetical protein
MVTPSNSPFTVSDLISAGFALQREMKICAPHHVRRPPLEPRKTNLKGQDLEDLAELLVCEMRVAAPPKLDGVSRQRPMVLVRI